MSKMREYELMPSTIETIDRAFFNWLKEGMNIHTDTNKGWKKVPVIWLSAERNFHIKNDKDLRDSNGVLKLPLISIERASIVKDPIDKGGHYAALPSNVNESGTDLRSVRGGTRQISRRISQAKTSNNANERVNRYPSTVDKTTNPAVVYETITVPVPVYLNINYNIVIKTDYQQQANQIIATFINHPDSSSINSFIISADGHTYEAFLDVDYSIGGNISDVGESEKLYEASLAVKVQGYIMGSEENDDRPKIVVRENAVEVKISRERTALGDINPYLDRDKDYREF
tara:strand:+ start:1326 stop:2186 length:861 start_codon:yes stop_codon:yes gene_type:complete